MPSPLCESKWAKGQRINKQLELMLKKNDGISFSSKEIADFCEVDESTIRKIEREAIRKCRILSYLLGIKLPNNYRSVIKHCKDGKRKDG